MDCRQVARIKSDDGEASPEAKLPNAKLSSVNTHANPTKTTFMRKLGLVCNQCNDAAHVVTPLNGCTVLAKTLTGEIIVALHKRCQGAWADKIIAKLSCL